MIGIQIVPLTKEVFKHYQTQIESFESNDSSIDKFLKENALANHSQHKGNTTLILVDGVLQGFFTLTCNVFGRERLHGKTLRNSVELTRKGAPGLHILALLGQLAKDKNATLTGDDLIGIALDSLVAGCKVFGIGYIAVECKHEDKLIQFYERNGFVLSDKSEELCLLICSIDKL